MTGSEDHSSSDDEHKTESPTLADLVDLLERRDRASAGDERTEQPNRGEHASLNDTRDGRDGPRNATERSQNAPERRPSVSERSQEAETPPAHEQSAADSAAESAPSPSTRPAETEPTEDPQQAGANQGPSLADLVDRISARDDPPEVIEPELAPETENGPAENSPGTGADLAVDDPNVLLLGPEGCATETRLCTDLSAARGGGSINLLVVTYGQSAARRAAMLDGFPPSTLEHVAIVSLEGSTQTGSTITHPAVPEPIPVESLLNAADVMKLGFAVSKYLTAWQEEDAQTVVCFHSLTRAIRVAPDPKLVLRFLHILQNQVKAARARAHFHLDPEALDAQTLNTFTTLFETVVAFERDGSVSHDH
ncbi:DUF7504 family protein [Halobellus captivus]|uniref:DUF7504 family protein n=1 Tax=Halobellus captivus TaxID=2592614 RepID=UPI0011A79A52|nr:hypothetical protein [Halobellus captivus]